MMKGKQFKQSTILQELESDDELPDVYNDVTIPPAYLLENRFDDIKFAWIHNVTQKFKDTQSKAKNEINRDQHRLCEKLYIKGVLKHQDLYCIKSVEPLTCNSTLIWFVNFLLHKDLQSHYRYLKSCLVNDPISPILLPVNNQSKETNQDDKLEIVIKF